MKYFVRSLKNFIRTVGAMICTPAPQTSVQCNNIRMLLLHLCDFNQQQYCYILQWLAYSLRNPGAKMCYGLIVAGDHGTGKSLFFQHVAVPLFKGMGRIVHADVLSDRFNNWAGAPLVVIDGNITQRTLARIKGLMTSNSLVINRKGPLEIPNGMNFVFLSGDINALRLDVAERRFMILEAPPARERAFYRAVAHEIREGGIDAFRRYLLREVDLTGFNETTRPPGLARADAGEHAAQEAA